MALLILGLFVWYAAHLVKRLAPDFRGALTDRFGDSSKGIVALLIVVSVVLMVLGYKNTDFSPVYQLPGWTFHLNNLLMLIAVVFIGMGNSKGRARSWFRHPMLIGFLIWVFAHLLVNGDLASIILFGGLGAWAIASILLINAQDGEWVRPEPGPPAGDVKLIVISLVVFVVIAGVHALLGPSPFGGSA